MARSISQPNTLGDGNCGIAAVIDQVLYYFELLLNCSND